MTCTIALYFQMKFAPSDELQKGQVMGMFVHGDVFDEVFAFS